MNVIIDQNQNCRIGRVEPVKVHRTPAYARISKSNPIMSATCDNCGHGRDVSDFCNKPCPHASR